MLARLIAYVRGIARRRRIDAEVDDELRFHLEQEIDAHVARGVSPAEARRMALRDLGGMTQTTEAVRDVRTIWLDLLVARRSATPSASLRATPAFTDRRARGADAQHRRDDGDLLGRRRRHSARAAVRRERSAGRGRRAQR